MNLWTQEPTCAPTDRWCNWVEDTTHNPWLAQAANWLIAKPLAVIGLVLVGIIARWLLHKLIDRLVARAGEGVMPHTFTRNKLRHGGEKELVSGSPAAARRVQRAGAMGSLLKSIVTGTIAAVVAIMALSELGADVAPLIASAGIIGVALGFGAQSLVKDFLSGIFMIFEDQYGVGDVIDAGEATGTVEAVGLRVTRIRDVDGTVWYVRNGEILRIGNMSQNWARTVLDVQVGYGEDLHRVREILTDVAHDMWEDEDYQGVIIEEPEVWGVQSLNPDGVTVRVVLKTAPLEQWGVAREMRERIKARFDYEGIEIPLPQRVVWHRDAVGVPQPASAPEQGAPTGRVDGAGQ
ncbi:MAG TPA: mechanosensitive ion channel family protein [Nocardioidaceae bacterium]|jgi:small conductance mechanosensitive channel